MSAPRHAGLTAQPDQITYIPATPGYYVLSTDDRTIDGPTRSPIIAWAVCDVGVPDPVTILGGIVTGEPPILCPDGRVLADGQEWHTMAHWLIVTTVGRGAWYGESS